MKNKHKAYNPAHKNQHKNAHANHHNNKLEAHDNERQDSGHEPSRRFSAYVRGNPLVSMGMAVAAGVLLSRMLAD